VGGEQEAPPEDEVDLVGLDGVAKLEGEQDDVDEAVGDLDLRALVALDDVLGDQRVEPELRGHGVDGRRAGGREVDPHPRVPRPDERPDLLDGPREPVNLVDEEHVSLVELGEDRRQVAGARDHRARGGAEADAHLARDDLRQGGLAEARRAEEQHVVEGVAAPARRLDEDAQVLAHRALADEVVEVRRPQGDLAGVLLAEVRRYDAGLWASVGHDASSLRPALMSDSTLAPPPRSPLALATAAKASARR